MGIFGLAKFHLVPYYTGASRLAYPARQQLQASAARSALLLLLSFLHREVGQQFGQPSLKKQT